MARVVELASLISGSDSAYIQEFIYHHRAAQRTNTRSLDLWISLSSRLRFTTKSSGTSLGFRLRYFDWRWVVQKLRLRLKVTSLSTTTICVATVDLVCEGDLHPTRSQAFTSNAERSRNHSEAPVLSHPISSLARYSSTRMKYGWAPTVVVSHRSPGWNSLRICGCGL
jgi:hypothetical protein